MNFQAGDIKRVVEDEDDFGHEMRVGHIFDNVQYTDEFNSTFIETPEHGDTYTDSVTGKPRQFDYRCRILADPIHRDQIGKCALLAVECKNLHESSPLVVCGRLRQKEEAYHTFAVSRCDQMGHPFRPIVKKASDKFSIFKPDEFVGKSLLRLKQANGQIKTDTQSDIYDRWSQALASSVELGESIAFLANKNRTQQYFAFVMPIVVVPDGSLWTILYDAAGKIPNDPTQVDQCDFFVDRKTPIGGTEDLILTHIQFVTLKGFSDLLSSFVQNRKKWDRIFPLGLANQNS